MSEKRIPIAILFWNHDVSPAVIDGLAIVDRKKGLSIIAMENVNSSNPAGIGDVLSCLPLPFKELPIEKQKKWRIVEAMIKNGVFIFQWFPSEKVINDIRVINKFCPFNGGK